LIARLTGALISLLGSAVFAETAGKAPGAPARHQQAAAITMSSSGPSALAPAVAPDRNVLRSAAIARLISFSSWAYPAAELAGPVPITSVV
jgi:hypothetical protein